MRRTPTAADEGAWRTFALLLFSQAVFVFLIVPFQLYSSRNALFSTGVADSAGALPDPRFALPLVESGSRIQIRREEGIGGIDLLYLALGLLGDWKTIRVAEGAALLVESAEEPLDVIVEWHQWYTAAAGLWRGDEAGKRLVGALIGVVPGLPGHREESWGSSVNADWSRVSPYCRFELPLASLTAPTDSVEERTAEAEVTLAVASPLPQSTTGFRNRALRLGSTLHLHLLSPEEAASYRALKRDADRAHMARVSGAWGLVVVVELVLVWVASRVYHRATGRSLLRAALGVLRDMM